MAIHLSVKNYPSNMTDEGLSVYDDIAETDLEIVTFVIKANKKPTVSTRFI